MARTYGHGTGGSVPHRHSKSEFSSRRLGGYPPANRIGKLLTNRKERAVAKRELYRAIRED